ncbi:MAG: hypothetical protein ACI4LA_00710 [Emergencia sp.]
MIDIGSNTVRAVIFHCRDGRLVPVMNKKYSAGLIGYVGGDGSMSGEGIRACLDILTEIRILIDTFHFDGIFPFATASLRNISNTDEVVAAIREETGMEVDVLSGRQEAFFDYYGAVMESGRRDQSGILADVGGGSTEIAVYSGGKPLVTESLPVGSLNMYNRFVDGLLPDKREIRRIQDETRAELARLSITPLFADTASLCGVGGTARAALKLYNREMKPGEGNDTYETDFLHRLLEMKWDKRKMMKAILKTAPERIHTLLPGIAVLSAAADYFGADRITTVSHGVREGYLYYKLQEEVKQHA